MSQQSSWDSYNDFLLQGSLDRFTKILARYELFKRVTDIPGDIVEGGVFKGTGVLYWAKLIQIFNPLSSRRVVGFDTFEGYPESTTSENDKEKGAQFVRSSGSLGTSPDTLLEIARSLGLSNRVELIKGDATLTIRDYVQRNPGFRIALLNLDFDTFGPSSAALEQLYSLVVPNGVIAFDEYACRGWGESDAVDKFFKDKHVTYKAIPWALSPTAFMTKEP